jgi:hypothetical protein
MHAEQEKTKETLSDAGARVGISGKILPVPESVTSNVLR